MKDRINQYLRDCPRMASLIAASFDVIVIALLIAWLGWIWGVLVAIIVEYIDWYWRIKSGRVYLP